MADTLQRLAYEAAQLLKLVGGLASADGGPRVLLAALGWDLPPGATDIGLAAIDLRTLLAKVDALDDAVAAGADPLAIDALFADIVIELAQAIAHIRAAVAGLSAAGDYLDKTRLKAELLPRLSGLLITTRIGGASPLALLVLQLFGVVKVSQLAADASIFQVEHTRVSFDWDAFGRLFKDPLGLIEARYGWGTAQFDGQSFVVNLAALVEALGEPVRVRTLPRRVEERLAGRAMPEADAAPASQLSVSLVRSDASGGVDAGLSLFPLRPSSPGAADGGIALHPFVYGSSGLQFALSNRLQLQFESSAALDSGLVLQFRPAAAPTIKGGLVGSGGLVDGISGNLLVRLVNAAAADAPHRLVTIPGGGSVEAAAIGFGVGVEVAGSKLAPSFVARITGGHVLLKTDGADSFLASILPAGGIDAKFDLGMRWSGAQGFAFDGSVSGQVDVPLHLALGGLHIDGLHIGLQPSGAGLAIELSVTGGAALGPVSATVDRIGSVATLAFRDGNLGPVDLGFGFKGPDGIGLSVDAQGVVSGGGFLAHDAAQGSYAGVMQLSLHESLTLTAFGLLATRLPDGSRGYSLLVFITAADFRPIPLGLGFTLQAIGGMLGVHRTFDVAVLRAGMQADTLKSLLFPRDAVANAPAVLQALAAAFPVQRGSYLLGLLVRIGWGTPTLILFDLALILEFGTRLRLLALGRISALLPTRDNDLVRLTMDAVGVLDFDAGTLAVDAMLVDSRLVHKYALTGAAALRAGWGSGPGTGFVLAVGGFNPRFAPPAGVPPLARVAIALSSGPNPRLSCEAYFALTANTLQFGARAQLYAQAYGFSVQGDVGFDVLLARAPLHFIADFQASVQLKYGSRNLFKVAVDGALEGPRPLRLSGKASFEIFWCDFTVRFDTTLIDGDAPPLPPAVDVRAELVRALNTAASWRTLAPAQAAHGVALRRLAPGAALVLDPLGRLAVQQDVVPLNTAREIDIFGGAPVAGERRFALSLSLSGLALGSPQPLRAAFAPAQFFQMSDDEKIASASFESLDAGLVVGSEAVSFDATQSAGTALQYESTVIDTLAAPGAPPPPPSPVRYTLPAERLVLHAASGAAARAPLRNVGRARFRTPGEPALVLQQPQWAIVPLEQAPPVAQSADPASWSAQQAALQRLNRGGAMYQLVPAAELAA